MSQNKTLLILTSSQNFSWFSMTEIIPEIEKLWSTIALTNKYKVNVINVDNASMQETVVKSFTCDLIVVTCFNLRISRTLKILRYKLEVKAPLKFYVHGMASVGLWPLVYWDWDKLWQKNDSFIVSCSRDRDILCELFPHINIELLPFTIGRNKIKDHPDTSCDTYDRISLYYVGRISEQKNIHTLLYAFSEHLKSHPSSILTLFGKEDELGSPNMGIKSIDYQDYLKSLSKELGIEGSVDFRGFVPREQIITQVPAGQKVFVSSSLHSDENFGMAVLEALSNGVPALISNWGGFADFKISFKEQVQLIDTNVGSLGPYIIMKDFINKMNRIDMFRSIHGGLNSYLREEVGREFKIVSFSDSIDLCDFSFAKEMVEFKVSFSDKIESCQIFKSYTDVNYLKVCKFYSNNKASLAKYNQIDTFPWVKVDGRRVVINDPCKGDFQLNMDLSDTHESYTELIKIGYAIGD